MDLTEAYTEIVQRSLESAEASIDESIQEAATFFAYHAFESLGGALCTSLGQAYASSHAKKINQFVAAAGTGSLRYRIRFEVAMIAMLVASVRNKSLYPEEISSGRVRAPREFITLQDARNLVRRVRGVAKKVKTHL